MGTKRSGAKGSFVSRSAARWTSFYADVVEDLRPWTPPAPQLPSVWMRPGGGRLDEENLTPIS